jgi:large subunit ribosomal protein L5
MNRLRQKYNQEIRQKLQAKLGIQNVFAVPQLKKIVVNMGIADFPQNSRQRMTIVDNVLDQFKTIAGQTPQFTKARKSIAGFKLREGDPMGVMVTLRGERMWTFLDKLISIGLPRVKDFQGVSDSFDGHGNYSLGIEEQIIFPEIDYDKIAGVRSLQVVIVTAKANDDQAYALLKELGMPFVKKDLKQQKAKKDKSSRRG